MATISFSDEVPKEVDGDVHFTFGHVDFDLAKGGTYETDDLDLISSALAHPWLTVKQEAKPENADEAKPVSTTAADPPQSAASRIPSAGEASN